MSTSLSDSTTVFPQHGSAASIDAQDASSVITSSNATCNESIDDLFDSDGFLIRESSKISDFDSTFRAMTKVKDINVIIKALSFTHNVNDFYAATFDTWCLHGWYATLKDRTYDKITKRVLDRAMNKVHKKAKFDDFIKFIDEEYGTAGTVKHLTYISNFNLEDDPSEVKEKLVTALENLIENKTSIYRDQILNQIYLASNDWQYEQAQKYATTSFDKFFQALINKRKYKKATESTKKDNGQGKANKDGLEGSNKRPFKERTNISGATATNGDKANANSDNGKTREEKLAEITCFVCNEKGHYSNQCPTKTVNNVNSLSNYW